MIKDIINKKVVIFVNDFIEENTFARIIDISIDNRKVLLQLDKAITYEVNIYNYVIATRRYAEYGLEYLEKGDMFSCGLNWISDARYNPDNPLDLSWWRGGAVAIASIQLVDYYEK